MTKYVCPYCNRGGRIRWSGEGDEPRAVTFTEICEPESEILVNGQKQNAFRCENCSWGPCYIAVHCDYQILQGRRPECPFFFAEKALWEKMKVKL